MKKHIKLQDLLKEVLTENTSDFELALEKLKKHRVNPHEMALRAKRGTAPYIAGFTKLALSFYPDNQAELDRLSAKDPQYEEYIKMLGHFYAQKQQKQAEKSIATDGGEYADLIKIIQDTIEPKIQEVFTQIKDNETHKHTVVNKDHAELNKDMPRGRYSDEFRAKYGRKIRDRYTLDSPLLRYLGMSDKQLNAKITELQEGYRNAEYAKINKLVNKLRTKYPSVHSFKLDNIDRGPAGLEFDVSAKDGNGNPVKIHTETIYAGGYNVQRLHFRWFMKVLSGDGKKLTIKQG